MVNFSRVFMKGSRAGANHSGVERCGYRNEHALQASFLENLPAFFTAAVSPEMTLFGRIFVRSYHISVYFSEISSTTRASAVCSSSSPDQQC